MCNLTSASKKAGKYVTSPPSRLVSSARWSRKDPHPLLLLRPESSLAPFSLPRSRPQDRRRPMELRLLRHITGVYLLSLSYRCVPRRSSLLSVRVVIARSCRWLMFLPYVQEGRVGQDDHEREQAEQRHLPVPKRNHNRQNVKSQVSRLSFAFPTSLK